MREFQPTYLCIKQHSVTGLKYLCKTTRSYEKMLKYIGSGKYWCLHLEAHGKEFVDTPWYCLFHDKESIAEFALMYSEKWNIVNSNEWANLRPENGLDGGGLGGGGANKGKKKPPRTAEHSANISAAKKGKKLGPQSEETKDKKRKPNPGVSDALTNRPKSEEHKKNLCKPKKFTANYFGLTERCICPHCSKEGGIKIMPRWHFDNCKFKKK